MTNTREQGSCHARCLCHTAPIQGEMKAAVRATARGIRFYDSPTEIVCRSNSRPTIKYPSLKMKSMLQIWPHELNAARLIDADPHVSVIRPRPCELEYTIDGKSKRHFSSFYVRTGADEIWDVVTDDCIGSRDSHIALLSQALAEYGYVYRVLSTKEINRQPRLSNLQIILDFARRPCFGRERDTVRRALIRHGCVLWGDAFLGTLGQSGRETICSLVAEGYLELDLDQPLNVNTKFYTNSQRRL